MKQVIIVRTDLKMGRGKLAAQVAHAAVTGALETSRRNPEWYRTWLDEGQAKVVVKVTSLEELLKTKGTAEEEGLPTSIVEDRGLTQLPPGTVTCMGIGPAPVELVDKVTGSLKLL